MPTDPAAPAWPDPLRPGVPLNPKKDGWHWVRNKYSGDEYALQWLSDLHWVRSSVAETAKACEYLGPCLAPSEVAAHAAAAWRAGVEAAADHALKKTSINSRSALAAEIRAITPPPEFAAALERVRSEERERMAALVMSLGPDQCTCSALQPNCTPCNALVNAVAAIRARAGGAA